MLDRQVGLFLVVAVVFMGLMGSGALWGEVIYVKAGASGIGTSWGDAYGDLQDALDASGAGDEIWVASGVYKPSVEVGGTGERYRAFQMKAGVGIYGGFSATGEPVWAERDPNMYVTNLSGDIGSEGDKSDNCYHVFYHADGLALEASAVLDGFSISGGNANGPEEHGYGGGMYNNISSPTVRRCSFNDNLAELGGGMYNSGSTPRVTGCKFRGNWSGGGGGMFNLESDPNVTGCVFGGNSAESHGGGGGMYNTSSSPTVRGCVFSGNPAVWGGGMYNIGMSHPKVMSCVFSGNWAYAGGGMYNSDESSPAVRNCTFSGNTGDYGEAMCNLSSSHPAVMNCIIWSEGVSGGNVFYNDNGGPMISFCDIVGCWAGGIWDDTLGIDGGGNVDVEPLFVDADGADGVVGTEDDDLRLRSYSPCIDGGDPLGDYGGQVDGDGQVRVRYGRVDMGAYEVYPAAGDFEGDEDVDLADLAWFGGRWLDEGCVGPQWCGGADIDGDGVVNLRDFSKLALHWLKGNQEKIKY